MIYGTRRCPRLNSHSSVTRSPAHAPVGALVRRRAPTAPTVDTCTNRATAARRADSYISIAPIVLVPANCVSRSARKSTQAAQWTTASIPIMRRSRAGRSRRSADRFSIPSRSSSVVSDPSRTWATAPKPRAHSSRTMWPPSVPAAPVTSIFFPAKFTADSQFLQMPGFTCYIEVTYQIECVMETTV